MSLNETRRLIAYEADCPDIDWQFDISPRDMDRVQQAWNDREPRWVKVCDIPSARWVRVIRAGEKLLWADA